MAIKWNIVRKILFFLWSNIMCIRMRENATYTHIRAHIHTHSLAGWCYGPFYPYFVFTRRFDEHVYAHLTHVPNRSLHFDICARSIVSARTSQFSLLLGRFIPTHLFLTLWPHSSHRLLASSTNTNRNLFELLFIQFLYHQLCCCCYYHNYYCYDYFCLLFLHFVNCAFCSELVGKVSCSTHHILSVIRTPFAECVPKTKCTKVNGFCRLCLFLWISVNLGESWMTSSEMYFNFKHELWKCHPHENSRIKKKMSLKSLRFLKRYIQSKRY